MQRHISIHTRWTLLGALMAMLCQPMASQADELYTLIWRGAQYSSGNGTVVRQPFSQKYFINEVARNYGISASDLVLVYRPEKRDISMVRRSTGEFVASIIQMEYVYTDVSNASQSSTVRQTFLFDEYHDSAIGTAFGTERLRRNTNGGIASYSFSGRFNYAYPEEGTVFSGSFSTGRKILDRTAN